MADCLHKRSLSINNSWHPLGWDPVVDPWWTPDQNCHVLVTWCSDTLDCDQQTARARDRLTVWPRHTGMQIGGSIEIILPAILNSRGPLECKSPPLERPGQRDRCLYSFHVAKCSFTGTDLLSQANYFLSFFIVFFLGTTFSWAQTECSGERYTVGPNLILSFVCMRS